MKITKKIILLGHFGVGKTSLIRRFVEDTFSDKYIVSIGVHILKKEVVLDDTQKISLIIWDLEGHENMKKIREAYLLGSHGFIYVFDITRPATFENLKRDIKYIKEKFPSTTIKVVGNKTDLVTQTFLKENMNSFGVTPNYFTSAKTGDKVIDLFHTLAKEVI